jgi:small subunit ribosomal protein S1
MDEEEIIEEEITGFNKGGLLIQFGQIQGFVPASQVISMRRGSQGQDYQQALQDLVGEELPLKVIEVDHRRRRLILSERQARREWRQAQKEEFLEELEESQIRTGVVTSFCDFGAFVNLGVMDGLIHISELSWKRVDKPSDVLELGQEIEVYVLSVDRERERIALSLKRLQPDPWEEAAGKYQEGQLVECVITNVVRFGAFARLEPGIEGLVHISELAEGPVREPEDIVQVGERLLLKVIRVDMERHRIALSLRQVTADDRASWYLASEPEPEEEEEPAWDEEDVVAGLDEPELDEAVEEDVGDGDIGDGDIGEEGIDAEDTGEEDIGEEDIDEESSDEEKVEEIDTEEEEQLEESAE